MPDQPPADPIVQLKQNIAALEEKQRAEGVDLSAEIQSLRALLAMLERPATTINQSGGVTAKADRIDIDGDVVGRDKHETIIAKDSSVAISGSTVHGNIQIGVPTTPALPADEALARYLQHVIDANSHLQLQGIRSSSGLVSIELEEIYITLTATKRRTVKDEQQWIEEMGHLAPGEARRLGQTTSERPRETVQQVKVKVQEALRDHTRLAVLGDPGSGKTTLLKYLALTFARTQVGEGNFVKQRLELAEQRLPILLPLRDFAKYLQEYYKDSSTYGPKLLLNFLNTYFENQDIKLPERFFADRLHQGVCLVLLDGVDEVADLPMRYRIARMIEKFTIAYPKNRYVVTSRIVGYTDAARLGEKFDVTTVRDFTWDDITRFVTYWNRSIEIALDGGETAYAQEQARQQTKSLLKAIDGNERVRELSMNPLMLTVIALVQRYRAQLPERRAELYEEAIEVLLGHWDVAKDLPASMTIAGRKLDAGDCHSLLEPVALWMMEQHAREIEGEELRRQLDQRFYEMLGDWHMASKAVDAFLHLIRERSGLLIERGQNIYAFSHLTFQEYLTARTISGRADYIQYTLLHTADSWWREVILLETGCLSAHSGKERVTSLIRAIMNLRDEPEPYHNLILAAECLRDSGPARVEGDLYGEVQRRLRTELERPIPRKIFKVLPNPRRLEPIRRRAAAAEALGRIESGVGTQPAFWRLPYGEPMWIDVPAGEFWMKDTDESGGKPVRRVNLPAFKIAQVPITNAQYRFFIEAMNHKTPQHWIDGKIPRDYESHPVVYVTWHDAMAYCRWLSEVTSKPIMLPSEAQWEKAARGAQDQREYPWGDEWDATKCNNLELGIGDTTPVGIFPDGASPYGCLDMVGNAWEWTRSINESHPYDPTDRRKNLKEVVTDLRMVRGGYFDDFRVDVRYAMSALLDLDPFLKGFGFRVVVAPIFQ